MSPISFVRKLVACTALLLAAAAPQALAQASGNCADAPNLTAAGSYPFDLANSNIIDIQDGCAFRGLNAVAWYKFTAPTAGFLTADTCGANFSPTITFFDACGGSMLACTFVSDDYPCASGGRRLITNFEVAAGQIVWVRISRDSAIQSGSGNLNLTFPDIVRPINDTCESALALPLFTRFSGLRFNTSFAATDGPEASCSNGSASANDVFYRCTIGFPCSEVGFSTFGNFESVITVLSGDCGSLAEIACGHSGDPYENSITIPVMGLEPGTSFLVRVAGWNGSSGTGYFEFRQYGLECGADFNGDGIINSDDLSDYITGYFASYFGDPAADPRCDFNQDGIINADDLGDYIVAYFNGC